MKAHGLLMQKSLPIVVVGGMILVSIVNTDHFAGSHRLVLALTSEGRAWRPGRPARVVT
jgi:DNA-binding LacI/PurR family transcriptional regulator